MNDHGLNKTSLSEFDSKVCSLYQHGLSQDGLNNFGLSQHGLRDGGSCKLA